MAISNNPSIAPSPQTSAVDAYFIKLLNTLIACFHSDGSVGIGLDAPIRLLHILSETAFTAVRIEATAVNSEARLELTNDALTWGLNVLGDGGDRFRIRDVTNGRNPFQIEAATPTNTIYMKNDGTVGFNTVSPNEGLTLGDGILSMLEVTAPTATTNYSKIWSQADNTLRWQDGEGESHLLQGDSFGSISVFALTTVAMTLPTQNAFKKIDVFEVNGFNDTKDRVTVDAGNNELSVTSGLGGAGEYIIEWHASVSVQGGAERRLVIAVGVDHAAVFTITGATTVTPIVITLVGHGLQPGDMVIQSGVGGMSEADGSFITQSNTADTYEIYSLSGVAVVGVGTYTSGGAVDIMFHGNLAQRQDVSQSSLHGLSAGGSGVADMLEETDKVALYAANLDGTQTAIFGSVTLGIQRVGD